MADIGRSLISKIVIDKSLVPVMTAGIKSDWFDDEDHGKVFAWMLEYHARYRETPTDDALHDEFPAYRLRTEVPESLDYYIDRFRLQRQRAILVDALVSSDKALTDDDPKLAENEMAQALLQLGKEVSVLSDVTANHRPVARLNKYKKRRSMAGEITGITTGFDRLDMVTSGWQPEQFIVMGGSQKQCKSYMLMKSAIAAQDWGRKVLFVSFEMSTDEQLERYDGMTCQVNTKAIKTGSLTKEELKRLSYGMRARRSMKPMIFAEDISATTTVSGISGKIEQYDPNIVFVDGIYLMENEVGAPAYSPQAYTSISRSLKRLAQKTKIPIIGTTQALESKMPKDGSVTMHSLAWTSAWAMDADAIVGVQKFGSENTLVKVSIVGGRNVAPIDTVVSCNWHESLFQEAPDGEEFDL